MGCGVDYSEERRRDAGFGVVGNVDALREWKSSIYQGMYCIRHRQPTVEETLGEYSVEYLNENYLYIGGEKFDVIFTSKNSLTLKSEKIIISITN